MLGRLRGMDDALKCNVNLRWKQILILQLFIWKFVTLSRFLWLSWSSQSNIKYQQMKKIIAAEAVL
jgi:hypothetical protein